MAKLILYEELHVTVFAPMGQPKATYAQARRTLGSKRFHARLRKSVGDVFRQHSSLKMLRFKIAC